MKPILERLYETFNRPEFLHTDPLIHLYGYDDPSDREVVGFVASSLAYGRVAQINRSVASVLRQLSSSPSRFVASASMSDLLEKFSDFKHRFTTGQELAGTLFGLGGIIRAWGSLNSCFLHAVGKGDETVIPALTFLVEKIREGSGMGQNSLLPSPSGGSACKRLNLFLRWMVRQDDIDPGGWKGIPRSMLLIPLDAHMHRAALALGFTNRRQADLRTVFEITDAFRAFDPEDPVKYDFAMTRPGICGFAGNGSMAFSRDGTEKTDSFFVKAG